MSIKYLGKIHAYICFLKPLIKPDIGFSPVRLSDDLTGLRPHTYSTLFGLLAVTGMRIGEIVALDHDDVDLKHANPHPAPVGIHQRTHQLTHRLRGGCALPNAYLKQGHIHRTSRSV